jgi:hypothetical protein
LMIPRRQAGSKFFWGVGGATPTTTGEGELSFKI